MNAVTNYLDGNKVRTQRKLETSSLAGYIDFADGAMFYMDPVTVTITPDGEGFVVVATVGHNEIDRIEFDHETTATNCIWWAVTSEKIKKELAQ